MLSTVSGFIEDVQHQAAWRTGKAAEYPDDKRNQRSADALYALARWLEDQPEDAPTLVRLNEALGQLYEDPDSMTSFQPGVTDHLGRYEFHNGPGIETPESFLLDLIVEIEDHLERREDKTVDDDITDTAEKYVGTLNELLDEALEDVRQQFYDNLDRERYEDEDGNLDEDAITNDLNEAFSEARQEFFDKVKDAEQEAWAQS